MADQHPQRMDNPGSGVSPQDSNLGMACHLLALAGLVLPPFGNVIGPLILWLVKKDESAFADDQGKEALNFNLSILLAMIIAGALTVILIGFVLLPIIWLYWLIMTIVAAVKASNGAYYRYPLTFRLLK